MVFTSIKKRFVILKSLHITIQMSYQFAVGDEIGLLKYVDVEQPEEEGGELSVTVRDIVGAPSRAHKIDMLNLSDCTDYLVR